MATEEKDKDLSAELMDQSREQKAKANDYALTEEESARGENHQKQRGAEDRAEEAGEAGREQAKKRSADTDEGAARGERDDKLQRGDAGVVQERRRVDPDLGAEELKKDRAVSDDEATRTEQKHKDGELSARAEQDQKAVAEERHKDGELSAYAEQRAKAESVNISVEARAQVEADQQALAEDKEKAEDSTAARAERHQKVSAEESDKGLAGDVSAETAAAPRVPKVI